MKRFSTVHCILHNQYIVTPRMFSITVNFNLHFRAKCVYMTSTKLEISNDNLKTNQKCHVPNQNFEVIKRLQFQNKRFIFIIKFKKKHFLFHFFIVTQDLFKYNKTSFQKSSSRLVLEKKNKNRNDFIALSLK